MRASRLSALVAALGLAACGPGASTVAHPTAGSASAAPVASAPAEHPVALLEPVSVPHVDVAELPSEVHVSVVSRPTTLVELRVLVGSGSAADGAHPGIAEIAARLVARTYTKEAKADPRAAASLAVNVGPDGAAFAGTIPPDGLAPTLAALGKAMSKPETDIEAMHKTSAELTDSVGQRARNVETAPLRFSIRDLYLAPVGRHPYSITLPSAEEIKGIDEKSVRSYFETHYVARNVSVIAVGPVPVATVTSDVTDAFAKLSVGPVAPLTLDPPDARPRPLKIMLVDEPKRDPVMLGIGRLGPAEENASASRLFGTITRDRIRAKAGGDGGFHLVPFRGGPSVAFLSMRVPAAHVADAVGYLRSEGEAWSKDPSANELVIAKNEITGELGRTIDSPPELAETLREALSAGAPETTLEREAFEVGTTGARDVTAAARDALSKDQIIVAIGDASTVGEALRALGEVDVLDPAQGFNRVHSLSKIDPNAAPPPAPPP